MSTPASPCPPTNRTECDPEFVAPPTVKHFYLRNKKRPNTNFIRAEVTPTGYFGYDVENTPDDGLGCPGSWLFDAAWDHFIQAGVSIKGIIGSWLFGANLDVINALAANNQMTLEEAAKQTWAFARASGKGFTTVQVLDSDGAPGCYTTIDVLFLP